MWKRIRSIQRSISLKKEQRDQSAIKRSATFCALPWLHLSTRPNGHMRLCCTANASSVGATNDKKYGGEVGILKVGKGRGKPANFNHTGLEEAWNSSYMKSVRKKMMNSQIPPSCTKCFDEEKAGHRSKRNWETEHWDQLVDLDEMLRKTSADGEIEPKIAYIDLRLGSKCNLKCVMCSPHDSSLWVKDWQQLYPEIKNKNLKETMQWKNKGRVDGASYNWHQNNPRFWKDLFRQIPHMQQLYFAGGEPLIMKEHYDLLRKCIDMGYAKNIMLRYNSNGVEFSDDLFELWSHFKKVRFHFSIDSIFRMNDYIRFPSQWSTIEKNLRIFDETDDHVEVTIACAVQILNMYYIPDFIMWKLQQNYKKINIYPFGAGLINYHFVYHPPHLNVKVFPRWFKVKIKKKYESFYAWLERNVAPAGGDLYSYEQFMNDAYGIKRLKGMVEFMFSEDWSRRMPEFREYIKHMDRIRATSFCQTFPEMADLMEESPDDTAVSMV